MAHADIAKQTSVVAGQRPRRPPRPERARGFGRRHGAQGPGARRQPGEAVGAGPVGLPRRGTPYPAEGLRDRSAAETLRVRNMD